MQIGPDAMFLIFCGPAGAGKTTLARAWCATRPRAVQIELDAVRELIVSGLADPQEKSHMVSEQYGTSARACCALARVFLDEGYDVAIDVAESPEGFDRDWKPFLTALQWKVVVVRPDLRITLRRNHQRKKQVKPAIVREQHAAAGAWPDSITVDSTDLSVTASLDLVRKIVDE